MQRNTVTRVRFNGVRDYCVRLVITQLIKNQNDVKYHSCY